MRKLSIIIIAAIALLGLGRGMAAGFWAEVEFALLEAATYVHTAAQAVVAGVVGETAEIASDVSETVNDTQAAVREASGHDIPPTEIPSLPYPADTETARRMLDTRAEAYPDIPAGPGTMTPGDLDALERLREQSHRIAQEGTKARSRTEGYVHQEAGLLISQSIASARLGIQSRRIRELACQEQQADIQRANTLRAQAGMSPLQGSSTCADRRTP